MNHFIPFLFFKAQNNETVFDDFFFFFSPTIFVTLFVCGSFTVNPDSFVHSVFRSDSQALQPSFAFGAFFIYKIKFKIIFR